MITLLLSSLLALAAPGGAQPDSVLAACDVARRAVTRALSLAPRLHPDTEVRHPFVSGDAGIRRGCRVSAQSSDRPDAPVEVLVGALQDAGWRILLAYMADGPDGSVAGFAVGPALCIVEGRWDGGDDADPTYVPRPGYDLDIRCFRRTAADLEPR